MASLNSLLPAIIAISDDAVKYPGVSPKVTMGACIVGSSEARASSFLARVATIVKFSEGK